MSDDALSKLAWSLLSLVFVLLFSGLLLPSEGTGFFMVFGSISVLFGAVGALVASRRQRNPIGWLFLIFAVVAAFVAFSDLYASHTVGTTPGMLPSGEWVAWVSSGVWHPAFGFFVFAFLLFPNGRLPSRRWLPVAWSAGAIYVVGGVLGLLWNPLFGEFFPYLEPPLRVPDHPLVEWGFGVFLISNFALLLLSAVSLVVRLRHSSGAERQQLKWFVYAVALFALVFPPSVWYFGDGRIIICLLPLVPFSAGIAILRHRLFDIDVVINRTLVYGSVTLLLAGTYFALVISSQYLLRFATGETSQFVIVPSTLAIAALFNPLRRRIQTLIDSRFYRRKYDARRVLDGFSVRLRDEVADMTDLDADLLSVVRETVHPTHASLWLRTPHDREISEGSREVPEISSP